MCEYVVNNAQLLLYESFEGHYYGGLFNLKALNFVFFFILSSFKINLTISVDALHLHPKSHQIWKFYHVSNPLFM